MHVENASAAEKHASDANTAAALFTFSLMFDTRGPVNAYSQISTIDLLVLWPVFHGLGNDSWLPFFLLWSWHHLFNPYTPRFP